MSMTTQNISFQFRPATECLSGAESAFVSAFVAQVAEYARRSGVDVLTALQSVAGQGASFDWRATEFLQIERVRIAVREQCSELDARARVSSDKIRTELAAVAFSSMAEFVKTDAHMPGDVTFQFDNLTPAQWAAVAEIQYEESATGGKRKYKLKLHPKIPAILALAEHVGFNDPSNPYRARELARTEALAPVKTFDPATDLGALQDAYSRLLQRSS